MSTTANYASGQERFHPDDGCPLFSDRLEEHIVGITRGELPNAGRFCGHCYTPMSPETTRCAHCSTAVADRSAVGQIPEELILMLRHQRRTERSWVTGFAYLGLLVAIVAGLGVVLGVPYLRANLLPAAIVYGLILFIGGRMAAGLLGGYWGDRIGFEKARANLLDEWSEWVGRRDTVETVAASSEART